jgi:formimidoylglutamase
LSFKFSIFNDNPLSLSVIEMKKNLKQWGLLGIPDHEAVLNLSGRAGAARGPWAFRQVFARFSGPDGVRESCTDWGDAAGLGKEIQKNHRQAADAVARMHAEHERSVVVGGAHDHGFSHLLGLKEALKGKRLGCINIDAHLDLRSAKPAITSGSPFYLAIEAGVLAPADLVEFGIQRHCNAPALWEYAELKKIPIVPFEELRGGAAVAAFGKSLKKLSASCDAVVVSLDLDALAESFAPGVSAPQAEGFTSTEVLEMVSLAGENKKVVSLGIFELNPEHDVGERTARVAATAAYYFIASGRV